MDRMILCAGPGEKDWDGPKSFRPLRTRGVRQAQRIGAWMGRAGLRPDLVVTAPDLRARTTAEKAMKAGGWTTALIQPTPALTWPATDDERRVLMVARRKDLCALMRDLQQDLDIRPGTLTVLGRDNDSATAPRRIDARDLPALFPYPCPDGAELRERPAYYYSQSAAIPFRHTAQGVEIMIVLSSSGRHWVVPKGIVEPGLTPAASAEIEAREEAGVLGRISDAPLGQFQHLKWGATCHVEVFALEVTETLPDHLWEERHRTRRWVSVVDAIALLQNPNIGPVIRAL